MQSQNRREARSYVLLFAKQKRKNQSVSKQSRNDIKVISLKATSSQELTYPTEVYTLTWVTIIAASLPY